MFYKGRKTKCKTCCMASYHSDPLVKAKRMKQASDWQDDNMLRYRFLSARTRSKKSGLEFSITVETVNQLWEDCSGNCYYTGLPMVLERSDNMNSVSLDRLDSSKGYVPGNVVLCRSIVNIMKSDLSEAEFSQVILALLPWAEKISAPLH